MFKVLFLENFLPPYRVKLYNELAKCFDVTVVCGVKNDKSRNTQWISESKVAFKYIVLGGIRIGSTGNVSYKYRKIIKEVKYDCIIIGIYSTPMGMSAIRYLKRKGIPFILNVDGGFIPPRESFFKFSIKKYFISKASMWITSGLMTNPYLLHYGAKKENIRYYPFSFISAEEIGFIQEYDKEKIRKKLSIKEKRIILFVGKIISSKGMDYLLDAMTKISNEVGCYIIGGLPDKKYLNQKKKLGLNNVHFAGFIKPSDLKIYYQMADIFVLPTLSDVWGLVVNEAMMNGLPVITTTSCMAGLELVKDGLNGYLIEPRNSEQLAEKIDLLLSKDSLRNTMAQNNVDLMKDFTFEHNLKNHIDIINEFCEMQKE